jgi:hypothetical protein
VQLSPFPCYFVSRRSKYSPQHPVLKHPQSVCALPLMSQTNFHTHTKQQIELRFCMF